MKVTLGPAPQKEEAVDRNVSECSLWEGECGFSFYREVSANNVYSICDSKNTYIFLQEGSHLYYK